ESGPCGGGTDSGTFHWAAGVVDQDTTYRSAGARTIGCGTVVLGSAERPRQRRGTSHLDRQTTIRAAAGPTGGPRTAREPAGAFRRDERRLRGTSTDRNPRQTRAGAHRR